MSQKNEHGPSNKWLSWLHPDGNQTKKKLKLFKTYTKLAKVIIENFVYLLWYIFIRNYSHQVNSEIGADVRAICAGGE